MAPVGRFAPTPSGALHLGSLMAAVASRCNVLQAGGHWHLRIDDADQPRVVPGAIDSIQRSLERVGCTWDGPVLFQSERSSQYRDALETLHRSGRLYHCTCSRSQLPRGEIYPGRCRPAPDDQSVRLAGLDNDRTTAQAAIRLLMQGELTLIDCIQGELQWQLETNPGDVVVWRRDGIAAYHLACSIDDSEGVTEVVRGGDLLSGSAVQISIMQALGRPVPRYAHTPIVVDADARKLGKQTRAPAIDERPPIAVLQHAWQLLGQRSMQAASVDEFWREAIGRWSIDAVPQQRMTELVPRHA